LLQSGHHDEIATLARWFAEAVTGILEPDHRPGDTPVAAFRGGATASRSQRDPRRLR
jgi:hypothetical protein